MNLNVGVTMTLRALRDLLAANPEAPLRFTLPDGAVVPPHFHVTEVGRVRKDFMDCGGTVRATERCVLQLWTADDEEHRLTASKLARILGLAAPLLGPDDLPVEVEYDVGVITQFPVRRGELTPSGIAFELDGKHTACLAPDRCGVGASSAGEQACCGPGCC